MSLVAIFTVFKNAADARLRKHRWWIILPACMYIPPLFILFLRSKDPFSYGMQIFWAFSCFIYVNGFGMGMAMGIYKFFNDVELSKESIFLRIKAGGVIFVIMAFIVFAYIFYYACCYSYFGIYIPDTKTTVSDFDKALYLSSITFSTVGYGDVVPAKGFSQVIAAVEAINSFMVTGAIVAAVISAFSAFLKWNDVSIPGHQTSAGDEDKPDKIWVWKCRSCDTWAKITDMACGCRAIEWIAWQERTSECDAPPVPIVGPKCKVTAADNVSD